MCLADRVPGMRPGDRRRNVVVALLYLAFVIPILVVLSPIIAGVVVAQNRWGVAKKLHRVPGISQDGGLTSGVIAFAVLGVLLLLALNVGDAPLDDPPRITPGNGTTAETAEPETVDPNQVTSGSAMTGAQTKTGIRETPVTESQTVEAGVEGQATADEVSTQASPSGVQGLEQSASAVRTTAVPTESSTPSGPGIGTSWTVRVTRVIDGDTIEVRFPNGEVDTVRFLGVDTPETTLSRVNPDEFPSIPATTAGADHLYNWGERASAFTRRHLSGESVHVEVDPEADRRGSFGRLLVYVSVEGEDFNRRLLTEGYARFYDSQFSRRSDYAASAEQARASRSGLWNFDRRQSPDSPTGRSATDGAEGIPPLPDDGDYDCDHFDTQDQAQQVLNRTSGDPHQLDGDDNGVACESLP